MFLDLQHILVAVITACLSWTVIASYLIFVLKPAYRKIKIIRQAALGGYIAIFFLTMVVSLGHVMPYMLQLANVTSNDDSILGMRMMWFMGGGIIFIIMILIGIIPDILKQPHPEE